MRFLTLLDQYGRHPIEAFYGGAAGGGKSEALLMAAAMYVEIPDYSALILRKTLPDLNQQGALIPRSQSWWRNTQAIWNEQKKRWLFPSGAAIRFGYLEKDSDLDNYMGSEYQFIGFDEATQFLFHRYRFLFSRLRRSNDIPVPLRVRAASNPGNVGHAWVKERFFAKDSIDKGRHFVLARLSDNPSIDEDEYTQSLDQLDPVTRLQLLEGDWNVSSGAGNFRREWFKTLEELPGAHRFDRVVRYWDTAATAPPPGREASADWTCGVLMGRTDDGMYIIIDIIRFQGNPSDVERVILNTARMDGADVDIFMEQDPGAAGKIVIAHYEDLLDGYYFEGVRTTGPKPVRAKAFSSGARSGNVYVYTGELNDISNWMTKFFDELEAFPEGLNDDQVDAAAGAYNQLHGGREVRQARQELRNMFSWRS